MQSYKIISDSSCDLPQTLLESLDIDIVPYYVTFDTVNYYREQKDLKVREFYDKVVSEKLFPKTSLPPIQDYIDVFQKYLKEGLDIICMCLSSKFSGSYQSAENARQMLKEKFPDRRIVIFDTLQATGGQGLVVYEAAQMRKAGMPLDTLIEKLDMLKKTARIHFTVDSLDHLSHGGRIGRASALAGSLLNIKPIIIMKDGELFPVSKVRGKKKAMNAILKMTSEEIGNEIDKYDVCIISADRHEDAVLLETELKNNHGIAVLKPLFDVGVTIGTHAGPTALGICFIKKFV